MEWKTIDEYAAYERVGRRTVYKWLGAGKLVTRRTPGGRVRIAVDSDLSRS